MADLDRLGTFNEPTKATNGRLAHLRGAGLAFITSPTHRQIAAGDGGFRLRAHRRHEEPNQVPL